MASHVIVRHQVQDFDTWKPFFDAHIPTQLENGLHLHYLLQNKENKNEITVHFEVKDIERAKKFIYSDALREVMQKAGVIGNPEILFLQDALDN